MSNNLFEQASRLKLRFQSIQGPLSVEHLWDLPLTDKNKANLNDIAVEVDAELTKSNEKNFVKKISPAKAGLELKLEILKHIIAVRLAEDEEKLQKAALSEKKEFLQDALRQAEQKKYENMTPAEIQAEIDKLSK